MNKQTFAEKMTELSVVFNVEVSKEQMSLYYEDLKHLTDIQFHNAALLWRKTGKFFPKPAEILECVRTAYEPAHQIYKHEAIEYTDNEQTKKFRGILSGLVEKMTQVEEVIVNPPENVEKVRERKKQARDRRPK